MELEHLGTELATGLETGPGWEQSAAQAKLQAVLCANITMERWEIYKICKKSRHFMLSVVSEQRAFVSSGIKLNRQPVTSQV